MKRFYEDVSCVSIDGKWEIRLDGRCVKTPLKAEFSVPYLGLAEAVMAEWQGQGEDILPETMPLVRMVNTVIDKVRLDRDAMTEQLLDYAPHDLLLYRAEEPQKLVVRQVEIWQPILDWFFDAYGVRLVATEGIMPVSQDEKALGKIADLVAGLDDWHFAVLQNLAGLTGSLVIAFAIINGELSLDDAMVAANIDEAHQAENWGLDARVERLQGEMRAEIEAMQIFLELCE